ncbi:MAG TPA: hypothetical protein VI488_00430, partial [Candidatus Angelobacter sp.]
MFYFQQLLNQGLNGIDRTAMIPTVVGIAYAILLVGFLIGLYQAAMRGGDVQALAVTGIKYLVIAIILANWTTVFREVNDSFNQVAQFIDNSSGAGDMFLSWLDQLKDQFGNNGINAILPSISGTMAAITTALMTLAAYLIYAMMVVVFAFFYMLYGCVLYVLGPLVLALLPMAGVGQLAKSYATNLMIWNAWGLLYATFGSLITAIQFNRVDTVINQGFLKGFFRGSADSTVLGLVSVFYALALGLIPLIAKRLISGDVGSAVSSLVRAGATAAGAILSGVAGFGAGAGAGSSAGSGAGVSAGSGAASSGTASSATAATSASLSSSSPPPQPSLAQTIRSGIMSAVDGSAPSAPPPASAPSRAGSQHAGASGSGGAGRARAGGSGSSQGFRPVGATQTIAFHAGKLAGSMVSNAGNEK